MKIEFCGCKGRCAEEDTLYTRPRRYGVCQVAHTGHTPESLAETIIFTMTPEERATAIRQGAANMEDHARARAPNWGHSAIEACLDEIARRCTDAEEN
jgi:hypothetical protein